MFESPVRLHDEIVKLTEAIRVMANGRYACIMEPGSIVLETPEAEGNEIMTLRRLLELHAKAIFALPAQMEAEGEAVGPQADPFEGWEHDELLLVFVNGRAALVVACPDAEASREVITKALHALVDRLLRWRSTWRLDERGRGLFFARPKLQFVTVAHSR